MTFTKERLLLLLDLLGTFVFAVEGATAASGGHFDVLGVLVLSFATALGGGIVRDILLGMHPVAAIRDWRYPGVAFAGGAIVFCLHRFVIQVPFPVMIGLDAMGLSLCAVAGAEKATLNKIHPSVACLLAAVNGVGGGTIRDLLMARSPNVLHSDIYAVAALAGAAAMLSSQRLGLRPGLSSILGASVCFVIRVISVWQHWNLPTLT